MIDLPKVAGITSDVVGGRVLSAPFFLTEI